LVDVFVGDRSLGSDIAGGDGSVATSVAVGGVIASITGLVNAGIDRGGVLLINVDLVVTRDRGSVGRVLTVTGDVDRSTIGLTTIGNYIFVDILVDNGGRVINGASGDGSVATSVARNGVAASVGVLGNCGGNLGIVGLGSVRFGVAGNGSGGC